MRRRHSWSAAGAAALAGLLLAACGGPSGGGHALLNQDAPAFEATTVDGQTFRLADTLGDEPVLLNFFASW